MIFKPWEDYCKKSCYMAKGKKCKCKCKGQFHGMGHSDYIGVQKRLSLWNNEESNLNFGEHFTSDKILLELVH